MANNTIAISTPTLTINNVVVEVVPNSISYTEGFGEYTQRTVSSGGGSTNVVFSENAESKKSKIMLELLPTQEIIEFVREIKSNKNANVVSVVDNTGLTRTIRRAAIINDYEVSFGSDATISIEFEGSAAV